MTLNIPSTFGLLIPFTSDMTPANNHGRDILPSNVKPLHYDLSFEPDLDKAETFEGNVIIHLNVVEDTSSIVLNARDLTIISTNATVDGKNMKIKEVKINSEKELVTLLLEDKLVVSSKVELKMSFKGSLLHQAFGFYRSPYQGENGTSKVYMFSPNWLEKNIQAKSWA